MDAKTAFEKPFWPSPKIYYVVVMWSIWRYEDHARRASRDCSMRCKVEHGGDRWCWRLWIGGSDSLASYSWWESTRCGDRTNTVAEKTARTGQRLRLAIKMTTRWQGGRRRIAGTLDRPVMRIGAYWGGALVVICSKDVGLDWISLTNVVPPVSSVIDISVDW